MAPKSFTKSFICLGFLLLLLQSSYSLFQSSNGRQITFDFSQLDEIQTYQPDQKDFLTDLKYQIMEVSEKFKISKTEVTQVNQPYNVQQTKKGNNIYQYYLDCQGIKIEDDTKIEGIQNSDFHFYVVMVDEQDDNLLATSGACYYLVNDQQPTFGFIKYNMANMEQDYLYSTQVREDISSLIQDAMRPLVEEDLNHLDTFVGGKFIKGFRKQYITISKTTDEQLDKFYENFAEVLEDEDTNNDENQSENKNDSQQSQQEQEFIDIIDELSLEGEEKVEIEVNKMERFDDKYFEQLYKSLYEDSNEKKQEQQEQSKNKSYQQQTPNKYNQKLEQSPLEEKQEKQEQQEQQEQQQESESESESEKEEESESEKEEESQKEEKSEQAQQDKNDYSDQILEASDYEDEDDEEEQNQNYEQILEKEQILNNEIDAIEISSFAFDRFVAFQEKIYVHVKFNNEAKQYDNYIYKIALREKYNKITEKQIQLPNYGFTLQQLFGETQPKIEQSQGTAIISIMVYNAENFEVMRNDFEIHYYMPIQVGNLVQIYDEETRKYTYQAQNFEGFSDLYYQFFYLLDGKKYLLQEYTQQSQITTYVPNSIFNPEILVQVKDENGFSVQASKKFYLKSFHDNLYLLIQQFENMLELNQYNNQDFQQLLQSEVLLILEMTQNENLESEEQQKELIQTLHQLLISQIIKTSQRYDQLETTLNLIEQVMEFKNGFYYNLSDSEILALISSLEDFQNVQEQFLKLKQQVVNDEITIKYKQYENQLFNKNAQKLQTQQLSILDKALIALENIGALEKEFEDFQVNENDENNDEEQENPNTDENMVLQKNNQRNLQNIQNYQQILNLVQKISERSNELSHPNQEHLQFKGQYFSTQAQKMTYTRVKNLLFTNVQNAFQDDIDLDLLNSLAHQYSEAFLSGDEEFGLNSAFSVVLVQFLGQFQESAKQLSNFQNLSLKQEKFDSYYEDLSFVDSSIELEQGLTISYIFNLDQIPSFSRKVFEQNKYTCLQEDTQNNIWDQNLCDPQYFEDHVTCECEKIGKTVLVNNIDNKFTASTIFAGLEKEETYVYAVIVLFLGLQVVLSLVGNQLDKTENIDEIDSNNDGILPVTENYQVNMVKRMSSQDLQLSPLKMQQRSSSISKQLGNEILKLKKSFSSTRQVSNESNTEFPLLTQMKIFHMLLQIFFIYDEKISRVVRFQFLIGKYVIALGICSIIGHFSFGAIFIAFTILSLVLGVYPRVMNELQLYIEQDKVYQVVASFINAGLQICFMSFILYIGKTLSIQQQQSLFLATVLGMAVDLVLVQTLQALIGYMTFKVLGNDKMFSRPVRNIIMIQSKIH